MKTMILVVLGVVAVTVGLSLSDGVAQQSQPPQAQQQPPPPAGPSQQPPAPAAENVRDPGAGARSGLTIASDSLVGTSVRDAQGKDIGQVTKILIDPHDGKVSSVIIKRGGTLGMGGEEISVPWNALQVQRDENRRLVVTMQQPLLEQTPSARQQEQQRQKDQAPAASPAPGGQYQGGQRPPTQ